MNKKEIFEKEFIKPIVFWGMVTLLVASVLTFVPALYMYFRYAILPPLSAISAGAALILSFAAIFWIVEPLAFFPILGIPGTYMSFLAGNISNLRLPCSAIAQQAAGVQEGTDEGAIISTIGIGASVIVNIVVLTLGVIAGAQLITAFPPIVKKAFIYVLPAIFGGVYGQFAIRNYKLAVTAIVLSVILLNLKFIPSWITTPTAIFGTIIIGVWLKNQSLKKSNT